MSAWKFSSAASIFSRSSRRRVWRGGEIPEETYYYVLRLDIGEGAILRGDVTVIR